MRMGAHRFLSFLLCIASITLGACAPQQVDEPEQLTAPPVVERRAPDAKLIFGSSSLVGRILLDSPGVRSVGQFKQAQVSVQNMTDLRYQLEYKFDWYDARNFDVGGLGTWHRFTLTPKEMATFSSTGKTPQAARIVFTVRFPDDVFIDSVPADTQLQQPAQPEN